MPKCVQRISKECCRRFSGFKAAALKRPLGSLTILRNCSPRNSFDGGDLRVYSGFEPCEFFSPSSEWCECTDRKKLAKDERWTYMNIWTMRLETNWGVCGQSLFPWFSRWERVQMSPGRFCQGDEWMCKIKHHTIGISICFTLFILY